MGGTKELPGFHLSAPHLKLEYECGAASMGLITADRIDLCSTSASAILAVIFCQKFLWINDSIEIWRVWGFVYSLIYLIQLGQDKSLLWIMSVYIWHQF